MVGIDNPEDKIRKAIIDLQKPHPFFAYLVMFLEPKVMPESCPMQTIGVNQHGKLFYNREWVMGRSDKEMVGILCHEVLHSALLHMSRTGSRDKKIANISQDMVVNAMVISSGMILPAGGIPYDAYKNISDFDLYDGPKPIHIHVDNVLGKTWEEIYEEIAPRIPPSNGGGSNRSAERGWDEHDRESGGEDDGGGEDEWMNRTAEAAQYAKQQGKLPAGMSRILDQLLRPKVEWKGLLIKYLRPFFNPVDWSYQRPNRKSQVLETYLPNALKEHVEVEVVVDTSGSIGKEELTEFLSEIVGIANAFSHITMHVNFWDTRLQARYEVSNGDIPKILAMEPKGGGGTSMEGAFDWLKENNRRASIVVVFTDGYDTFSHSRNDYPFDIIWLISKRGVSPEKIPYGMKIKMDG